MKTCTQCGTDKPVDDFPPRRWKRTDGSYGTGYLAECRLCLNVRSMAYYRKAKVENPDQFRNYKAKYVAKDPEKEKLRLRNYKRDNIEKLRPKRRSYHQANKAKWAERQALRRATVEQRTPLWADIDAISFFYECRPAGCHVDHVIPLMGESVSGLHVETNLQWLPWRKNLSKGNRISL